MTNSRVLETVVDQVAELLSRPTYAKHMTTVWRHLILPEADTNLQFSFIAIGFDAWLKQQFTKNAGYDRMVKELLTADVNVPSVAVNV